MKKLLCALLLLSSVATLSAQEKNIFGVRAGLNIASLTVPDGASTNSKAGFQVGFSYERNLVDALPLYLETGLYFTGKGGKAGGAKLNLGYLQVPVLVNYHWSVSDNATIQPFAGLYYAFGIHGKGKAGGEKADLFGDEGGMRRSDLGVRLGAGVNFLKRYYAGLGYDIGVLNTIKEDLATMRTGTFFIQVGYKF